MDDPWMMLVFLIGIGVGVSLRRMVAAAGLTTAEPEPPAPRCPYCDHTLRPVAVADLAVPHPAGARWYCSAGDWGYQPCQKGVVYFADCPAGKPDPLPEEV
jgi:hypothetical protein